MTSILELNTAAKFSTIDEGYVGFTLSFLTGEVAHWSNTSILFIDLKSPQLRTLVKRLSPAILRVGGGWEYKVVMNVNGSECETQGTPPEFCLTMGRWHEILEFANDTQIDVVWGLGAQRRANGLSQLDFDNIRDFLAYTSTMPDELKGRILGFELGNELDDADFVRTSSAVAPQVLARDYLFLAQILELFFPGRHCPPSSGVSCSRPLLVGPAQHPNVDFARRFLGACGWVLDAFTFHSYVGYGGDAALSSKLVNQAFLEASWEQAAPTVEVAFSLAPEAAVWAGETSSAWSSGRCGVTDRWWSMLWYANTLGRFARGGVSRFAYHSLNGGCYALVNKTSLQPHPNYWLAVAFHDLMGTGVLDLRVLEGLEEGEAGGSKNLMVYAHTSKRFFDNTTHGATLLLINIDPAVTREVQLTEDPHLLLPRREYLLQPGSLGLDSNVVLLNGVELMFRGGNLSCLVDLGRWVNSSTGRASRGAGILVPPLSVMFVELPLAKVY
uniref:Beta-glucuronidase C-terminal domain-containing protein n=1 Tax=Guillardia theta TaxID=55529 RepID=A0A7S4N8Z8_GUITH